MTTAPAVASNPLARFLTSSILIRFCRVAIGLVFIAAALAKIGDAGSFAAQIHNYRLLPVAAENLVAILLPWVELIAGLALVLGVQARSGAVLTAAMMVVFTAAVGQAVARNLDIECGCFGTADAGKVGAMKMLENLVFTGTAIIASLRLR
jgi:uncharacterized membrane protein YphA (DoxX/SURF4 family)